MLLRPINNTDLSTYRQRTPKRAIFSALKKYRDDNEEENESKRLMSSMILLEEDADEEYFAKHYDTNMSMVNCGGLMLVSPYFFEWGKDAMEVIRNAYLDGTHTLQ